MSNDRKSSAPKGKPVSHGNRPNARSAAGPDGGAKSGQRPPDHTAKHTPHHNANHAAKHKGKQTDGGTEASRGPKPVANAAQDGSKTPAGDRIAKVLSRAGIASRREAEKMIAAGRVTVNGTIITSAALNVTPKDKVVVDGRPIDAPEPARLWMYHKPAGLVTTTKDEQGRPTIFDDLPDDLPRVMSVGRLDLNSEGLLLLTNDGGLKRKLELPSTGWLRRYRVRVKGNPTDAMLEPLRDGIVIDREMFQPMQVTIDRQQGANAWLTIGLREGKNREIRRAMDNVGMTVNRLIRISYGPFQLGPLKQGDVEEVRRRVLRDQLGVEVDPDDATKVNRPKPQRVNKGGRGASGRTAETAEGRPSGGKVFGARRSADRDGARDSGKVSARTGASGGKPVGKSGSKFGGKPGGKPNDRPGGKAGARGAGKSSPQSTAPWDTDGPSRPKLTRRRRKPD